MFIEPMSSNYPSKILYSTKFLELKETKSPDGSHPWYYAHRPNTGKACGVQVVPILHEKDGDKVAFVETERPPIVAEGIAQRCIEIPAGLVGDYDKQETVYRAAEKEVLQETGFVADKIEIILEKAPSSPGCVTDINSYAIADINNPAQVQKPLTDGGVLKKIHIVPIDKIDEQLQKWQNEGKAISALTLAGLYCAKQRLDKKGQNLDRIA